MQSTSSRNCTSSRIKGYICCKLIGGVRTALQIAANKAVFLHSHLQRSGAGFIDCRCSVLLCGRENAQDAEHTYFAFMTMDGVSERPEMKSEMEIIPLHPGPWRPIQPGGAP